MIFAYYRATTTTTLPANSAELPVSSADLTTLLSIIPEGETMALILDDKIHTEEVLAENQCGQIVLARGQGGTIPMTFPRGTCVKSELTLTYLRYEICNYDCCEGDCPCVPAAAAGFTIAPAIVGVPWVGQAVFTGDTPMGIGVTGMPSWMTATPEANYVVLSGTPTGAGTWTISVAATNCSGSTPAVQSAVLTVTAS